MSGAQLDQEKLQEMSMTDIAFEILSDAKKPLYYRELLKSVAEKKGLSEEELLSKMPQMYTDINIDGRFLCVGQNIWGLKHWYPMETIEESNEGNLMGKTEADFDDIAEDIDDVEDVDEEADFDDLYDEEECDEEEFDEDEFDEEDEEEDYDLDEEEDEEIENE